jgi:hypothetical protein
MRMDAGGRLVVAVAALVLLMGASSASAQNRSAYVPGGLTGTVETAHFVLHYDSSGAAGQSGMTIQQYAESGAEDFEESFGRLVTGGGGSPNAALKTPTADGDGKTDVYLAAPLNRPGFGGGTVYRDTSPWRSSYMFMTPGLKRDGFRFRAAHEFMHVIQNAYAFGFGDGLFEGFANWAAEFSLPDVDPLDSNFYPASLGADAPHPWLPLDCSFGDWDGNECGRGYWQWLFVQAQVEDYGPDFVPGYLEYWRSKIGTDEEKVANLLDHEIKAQSGGADDLRGRFALYARDVWDPTRWTTGSISQIRDQLGFTPASFFLTVADRDTGVRTVAIDHLAARYVEVFNYLDGAREGDLAELSWQRPEGMAAPVVPLIKRVGQDAWVEGGSFDGTQGSAQLDLGPGVERIVLPLVNDSLTADDQPFSYRMRIVEAADHEPPDVAFLIHPPKRTSKHRARFAWEASEDATFECALDRARFKRCRTRTRVRVGPGRHRFAVRATDLAGNAQLKPELFRWKVTRD